MKTIITLCMAMMLAACASTPLTHNYKGDVGIRQMTVDFQSLNELTKTDDKKQNKINEIQRILESIDRATDDEALDKAMVQMRTFEQTMLNGVREAADLPLVSAEESSVVFQYGKDHELTGIRFEYPVRDGAYLDLYGYINYTSVDITRAGINVLDSLVIRVKPELDVQIEGKNEKGEAFWSDRVSYTADRDYVISQEILLGYTVGGIKDADIFMVPLAKGWSKALNDHLHKK